MLKKSYEHPKSYEVHFAVSKIFFGTKAIEFIRDHQSEMENSISSLYHELFAFQKSPICHLYFMFFKLGSMCIELVSDNKNGFGNYGFIYIYHPLIYMVFYYFHYPYHYNLGYD